MIALRRGLAWLFFLLSAPAMACDLALALAVDVSGSVDPDEYRIQRQGLADALRDGAVSEALVRANARVSLTQWSGTSRQRTTIPWREIRDFDDIEALAREVAADPRIWRNYSTGIGEALAHVAALFAAVPDCTRRVIDISGDGRSNEGPAPETLWPLLAAQDITVNALVIEGSEEDLTAYFETYVIAGAEAFAETANGFADYPDAIRRKLSRETVMQLTALPRRGAGICHLRPFC